MQRPRSAASHPAPTQGTGVNNHDVAVDPMVAPHQAGTTKASARAAG